MLAAARGPGPPPELPGSPAAAPPRAASALAGWARRSSRRGSDARGVGSGAGAAGAVCTAGAGAPSEAAFGCAWRLVGAAGMGVSTRAGVGRGGRVVGVRSAGAVGRLLGRPGPAGGGCGVGSLRLSGWRAPDRRGGLGLWRGYGLGGEGVGGWAAAGRRRRGWARRDSGAGAGRSGSASGWARAGVSEGRARAWGPSALWARRSAAGRALRGRLGRRGGWAPLVWARQAGRTLRRHLGGVTFGTAGFAGGFAAAGLGRRSGRGLWGDRLHPGRRGGRRHLAVRRAGRHGGASVTTSSGARLRSGKGGRLGRAGAQRQQAQQQRAVNQQRDAQRPRPVGVSGWEGCCGGGGGAKWSRSGPKTYREWRKNRRRTNQ